MSAWARLTRGNSALAIVGLVVGVLAMFLTYASVATSISHWQERPFGADDFCYFRQAQLFQKHGLVGGLDTSLQQEPARYLIGKAKQLGLLQLPETVWNGAINPPCHWYQKATDRSVLQYPPGTGFVMSLFPAGMQERAMYIASATFILLVACAALLMARTTNAMVATVAIGCGTLYLMINPAKASFSIAPSIALCILLGLLTVRIFEASTVARRIVFVVVAGLALGFAVNVRLPNLFLAAGYFAVFAVMFFRTRSLETFVRPIAFAVAMLIGLLPTLAANAINAGSPFATTYGGVDTVMPRLQGQAIWQAFVWYSSHTQGVLLWASILAVAAAVVFRRRYPHASATAVTWIVLVNLVSNMAYFLTHQVLSQYYIVPLTLLSLWTLYFSFHSVERARAPETGYDLFALPRRPLVQGGVIAALLCGLVVFLVPTFGTVARGVYRPQVGIALPKNAIIWANWSAGLFDCYLDRYAAHIAGVGAIASVQTKMLRAVTQDGRPQFFVMDGKAMRTLVKRAAGLGTLTPAGTAFGYDVLRLDHPGG